MHVVIETQCAFFYNQKWRIDSMKCVKYEGFVKNAEYYLGLLEVEEKIYVIKDGGTFAILENPRKIAYEEFIKLRGCLKNLDDGRDYKEIIGDAILEANGIKA